MTFGGLLRSVRRREWLIVFGAAVLTVILTSIPPLTGLWVAWRRGLEFKGIQFLSPGDFGVYLSYITQVRDGGWLQENIFTAERMVPFFNILWCFVGTLARLFALTPLAAFHLARSLLIFPLAAVIYLYLSYLFVSERRRTVGFLLLMFGTGIGLYLAAAMDIAGIGAVLQAGQRLEYPVDMWVAESQVFLSMLYSPHFVASWCLMLLGMLLMMMSLEGGSLRLAVAAGIVCLALFQFHPFHAPTLYAVPLAWIVWKVCRGGFRPRYLIVLFTVVAISCPAIAYHYLLTHHDAAARDFISANLTLTPAPWHLAFGMGLPAVLWISGLLGTDGKGGSETKRVDFLAVWVVVQLLLVYSPLTFQRRLLEGLQFPLVALSVPMIAAAVDRLKRASGRGRVWAASAIPFLFLVLFLPSSFASLYRGVDVYVNDRPPIFFFSQDESRALDWIRRQTPRDIKALSTVDSGNMIAGWAGRRVFAGHWANTVDLESKTADIKDFFGAWSRSRQLEFIRNGGISLIWCGPAERAMGGCPDDGGAFLTAAEFGDIRLIEVHPHPEPI